jgi:hypothetical protein
MLGLHSYGKSSSYFIKRIASRPWLANSKLNSNEMFWLIVKYFRPLASIWDSCWSAKAETKAITEMIAITS